MRGLPGSRNSDPAVEQLYDEEVCLFDREHICPVCGRGFTAKSVRAGKVISDGMDIDMRPRSKNLDMMKYRVLECPICGMEEPTFDYLMAVLTYKQGNRSDAQRFVIRALQSRLLKPAIRPMAEDLRDMIKANEPID